MVVVFYSPSFERYEELPGEYDRNKDEIGEILSFVRAGIDIIRNIYLPCLEYYTT